MAFGQVVRAIRKDELGISQAELEKRTGLDRTFISDLERVIQAKGLQITPWDLIRRPTRSSFCTFPLDRESYSRYRL
jgi:transcriptional regulator with XRE-family HTH domain